MPSVLIHQNDAVVNVRLNRPDVKNAFNDELIVELISTFKKLESDPTVRVVILSGEGTTFCAGADLKWMKSFAGASKEDNEKDARKLAEMLTYLNEFPKPIIGQVHGAAIGGGVGLVAICDVVIAAEGTVFALAEVKLGLIPAVISPFVISKMSVAAVRRYFLTGERFDTKEALRWGLLSEAVPMDQLEGRVTAVAKDLLSSGPQAIRECKELIRNIGSGSEYTVKKIATLRTSPEGQEGMKAFLEKRKPNWVT